MNDSWMNFEEYMPVEMLQVVGCNLYLLNCLILVMPDACIEQWIVLKFRYSVVFLGI